MLMQAIGSSKRQLAHRARKKWSTKKHELACDELDLRHLQRKHQHLHEVNDLQQNLHEWRVFAREAFSDSDNLCMWTIS